MERVVGRQENDVRAVARQDVGEAELHHCALEVRRGVMLRSRRHDPFSD
jgi:hypothetical protein